MKSSDAIRAIIGLRLFVGGNSWLTPRLSSKLAGFDPRHNEAGPYLLRLFAVRDLVLGVGLMQSKGDVQRQWLQLGLACDVADTAAAVAANRRGEVRGRGMVSALGGALAATALGAFALRGADGDAAA